MEVKIISDYLKANMPLPQYLPYARFLLDINLSHTAKLLYTLLLDRATLSQKNNWVDSQGRIYVVYPLSHLAKDLGCCISSVTRSFAELEKAELAERVRSGFSKPSHILLKVPHTVQNCAVTVCTSAQSDCAETHSMIAQKCTPNQRNKNNPKDNHLIRTNTARLSLGESIKEQKHLDLVRRLKADGFSDPEMLDWTFENDNGRSPQIHYAHRYVEQWQTMRSENIGLLLWGGVGTGKSFLAGCIANALMAQEVPVRMTNFAHILNELNNSFSGRNEVVDRLCRYPLLIIDDFGMERGTEYALEQIYNIIDSRYRSRNHLIVTTNLTLDEIRHPQDTAHARIYDRLLEMCVPISCIGFSFRKETAQEKLERLKELIG